MPGRGWSTLRNWGASLFKFVYVFMAYLTTLSVASNTRLNWRGYGRKEAVVTQFKVVSRRLSGGTEEHFGKLGSA
jgi:hypothetical protein